MPIKKEQYNSTDSRITRLETSVEGIGKQVSGLETELRDLGERFDRQFGRIQSGIEDEFRRVREENVQRKTPTVVWVSLATLAAMLVIAGVSAAYALVAMTTSNINDKAQRALDLHNNLVPVVVGMQKSAKEVETQFRLSQEIHNMHFAEQQRTNQLLTQIAQGVKPIVYPGGPYYFPRVTNNPAENEPIK